MSDQALPPGWDEARIRRVIDHYENVDEEEQTTEDEAARNAPTETLISVPVELVPLVRELIAQRAVSGS